MKKVLSGVAAGLSVLAVLAGCSGGHKNKWGGNGTRIKVRRGDLRELVQTTGNVSPLNKVSILPPESGRIDKIVALEGDTVKQGQILAWMSSSDRAALLDSARALGQKEVDYWKKEYSSTPILAPEDGVIISRNIVEGQTVSGSTDLYDLSDRLVVFADVDETDLGKVHMGQIAQCRVDAYPDQPFQGKVTLIGHQAIKVNNVVSYQINVEPLVDAHGGLLAPEPASPSGQTGSDQSGAGRWAGLSEKEVAEKIAKLPADKREKIMQRWRQHSDSARPGASSDKQAQAGQGADQAAAKPAPPMAQVIDLRAGMTASADFVANEKKGVLILPNYAVKNQSNTATSVKVMGAAGKPEDRNVVLGSTDGAQVEVKKGLEEGEEVLVSSLTLPKALAGGPMSSTGTMKFR
jgi:multidrug efflux pump subunit AcrA (membrane-fusion protein)